MNKIYFAGPDVFKLNAHEIKDNYLQLSKDFGYTGLFPLDNEVDLLNKHADSQIFQLNIKLLKKADYVLANLNPFRGYEPDSGTVFEVAYALAIGKPVIGYIKDNTSMLHKIQEKQSVLKFNDFYVDENNLIIENFNSPLNLMLYHGITKLVIGNAKDALVALQKLHPPIKNKAKTKK